MKRPVALTVVVVLQWVAAVIAVIAGFDLVAAAFEMRGDVATQIEGALVNQGVLDVSGRTVVTGVFMAGILLLVIAFVRVMVAVYLARGRGWARIVVAIFALVSLVGGLASLFNGQWLQAVIVVAVEVVILVLLFNRQSSAFIAARSAER